MKSRKTRPWRRVLVGLLLLLCSAPAGLFFLLQTDTGREWLAKRLSLALSSGQRTVRVEKIRVPSPARAAIGSVSVSDPSGPWLTIRDLELQWNPLALLAGRAELRQLRVASLDLIRLPAAGGEAGLGSPSPPRVPEFRIEAVTLDALRLGTSVCGFPVALSGACGRVQGGASNGDRRVSFKAAADRIAMSTAVLERVVADIAVSFAHTGWGLSGLVVSGDGLRASGDIDFSGEGAWPTGSLQVEADGAARWAQSLWPGLSAGRFSVALDCAPRPDDREIVQGHVAVNELRVLGCATHAATAQVQFQRTRAQMDLAVEGSVRLAGFSAGTLTVTGAEFHVSGPWRTVAVAGTAGGVYEQPFTLDVAGGLQGEEDWRSIQLQGATLGWAGMQAKLTEPLVLRPRSDQTAINAAWRTEPFDLASVSNAVIGALSGRVTVGLRLRGTLAAPEIEGDVTCEALAAQVGAFAELPAVSGSGKFDYSNGVLCASGEARTATGGVARARVQVPAQVSLYPWVLRLDRELLMVEADASLGSFSAGALIVTGGEFHVSGPWRTVAVAGTAGGVFKRPFTVDAVGRLQWEEDRPGIELQRATVGWAGVQARLVEPLWVRRRGNQTAISAAWRAESFDLASVSNAVSGAWSGHVTAGLRVGGTLADPEFDGNVIWEGIAAQARDFADVPAVNGSYEFNYSNRVLLASAQASLATCGVANARVRVPLQVSLQPWVLRLDRDRDLSVALEAGLDLSVLNGLESFANGRISGRLDLSVAHAGTVSGGTVTGACVLANGEYENYVLGTVIRRADVRLVARDDTLVVESGSATDGGKGRLTLAGHVRLVPAEGLPYAFEIGCRKARLLRRADAEGTASGKLSLLGTVSRVRAEGDFQMESALVELQNLRPSPPAVLEPVQAAAALPAAGTEGGTNVTLRLAVGIPGNLYIRGRTLDSAWAGKLVLEYAGGVRSLSGSLEPRRGTILLLKRPFKLTEGRVDLDGRWPPDPSLRLTATYSRPDLSARVRVVGNARDPDITLTSEPSLPEDEILARILFGKDMSSVTPLQALSLASEAAKLRKVGGGTGLLGDVQSAVGIDRVEFREAGEGTAAPEVAAGEYLGDRSYVEMRRTTSTEQPGRVRLYLEHELRPNIVLEAESGLEMRSGVGLFWKRDY